MVAFPRVWPPRSPTPRAAMRRGDGVRSASLLHLYGHPESQPRQPRQPRQPTKGLSPVRERSAPRRRRKPRIRGRPWQTSCSLAPVSPWESAERARPSDAYQGL